MNLASTDEKKPLTEAEKEALAQQLWDNMLKKYDPERPWLVAELLAPNNSQKMFGLTLKRGAERLDFAIPMDELLNVYLAAPEACLENAAQFEMLVGKPSVAVSTADVPVSETLPLAS